MYKTLIIVSLFLIDIFTKKLIFNYIDLNNFIFVTPFLDLAHIHNFGISFGLFSGQFPYWFFVICGIIVTLIIVYMMLNSTNIIEKWGLTVIISGAISNIIDRMLNGYVIDFIYFHYRDFYWPAFNFADIYITLGILLIMSQFLKELFTQKEK